MQHRGGHHSSPSHVPSQQPRALKPKLVPGRQAGMSQHSRPSFLDNGVDEDADVLNRSWDVESRYRLQENALNLPHEQTAALFRVQVELGLHELTAAMSSLR